MISTLKFEHGDKTCAIQPGNFCRFFRLIKFGQCGYCLIYQSKLWIGESGWTERCLECLDEFPIQKDNNKK